ncbi:MAG: hypothetical protein KBA54_03715 [Candidatus Cloacimonetes bacterium]|nr:hypothetical protein [Candidatus Cloacimonadota bacterium]
MKIKALKIINLILMCLILLVVIGLIGYNSTELDSWFKLHRIAGILFLFSGFLHLALNWTWVRATYSRRKSRKK